MTDERTSDGSASEQTVPNPEPSVRAGGGAPSDRTSPVVVHGDCVAEMRKMPDASVDAIVTDPPFGLEFMGKKWDRLDGDVVDDPAAEGGFQDGAGGNPYSRSRVRYGTKTDADGFRRSENPADADRDDVFGRTSRTSPEYKTGIDWQMGGGFSPPGIGARRVEWPSFGATDPMGTANPTCDRCGGRLRGSKKCACEKPAWRVRGDPVSVEGNRVSRVSGVEGDRFQSGFSDGSFKGMVLPGYSTHRRNVKCPECHKWAYDYPDRRCVCGGVRRHIMTGMQAWHYIWACEALRVLKPGGHLVAAGGSRTFHRLVCALEDAGFEVRDCITHHYGSGFPKNLDVSQAIDDELHARREKVRVDATLVRNPKSIRSGHGIPGGDRPWIEKARDVGFHEKRDKQPVSEEAKKWTGYGTALKPATEFWALARKPLDGTVARNVLKHGVGAVNIDATRVPYVGAEDHEALVEGRQAERTIREGEVAKGFGMKPQGLRETDQSPLGRWPANLVLGHAAGCRPKASARVSRHLIVPDRYSPERDDQFIQGSRGAGTVDQAVEVWECVPGCPVAELDRQAGVRKSGAGTIRRSPSDNWEGANWSGGSKVEAYGDVGPVSRFYYVSKPSRAERDAGLYDETLAFSLGPMAGRGQPGLKCAKCGRWKVSGNPCVCTEPDFQPTTFERPRIANVHPTCKPVTLMRWLVRLVTPSGGIVLDPFAGSGTTGIACVLEKFRFIGIEKEADYVEIARRRIAHAERFPWDYDPEATPRVGLTKKVPVKTLAATRPLSDFAPPSPPQPIRPSAPGGPDPPT